MELVARRRGSVVRALARASCRLALLEPTLPSSPRGFGRRVRLSWISHRLGLFNLIVGIWSGLELGNWRSWVAKENEWIVGGAPVKRRSYAIPWMGFELPSSCKLLPSRT